MTEQSKVTPAANIDKSIINDAVDVVSFGKSSISDLGSLFKAIRDTSEKYSNAHELAGIGCYLSDAWGNSLDNMGEALKERLEGEA